MFTGSYTRWGSKIKRSVNSCFNSVKLLVILKSDVLFPPNLKDNDTILHKCFLIYKFLCKCVFLYRTHNTELRYQNKPAYFPSHIRTNTCNYFIVSSNQTLPYAIVIYWIIQRAQPHITNSCFPFLSRPAMNAICRPSFHISTI